MDDPYVNADASISCGCELLADVGVHVFAPPTDPPFASPAAPLPLVVRAGSLPAFALLLTGRRVFDDRCSRCAFL